MAAESDQECGSWWEIRCRACTSSVSVVHRVDRGLGSGVDDRKRTAEKDSSQAARGERRSLV